MLERFHVPEDIAVRVDISNMQKTVENIFLKMGMTKKDSTQAADVLLYADIRGIETHGVSNMLRGYVKSFGEGGINPTPKIEVVREMEYKDSPFAYRKPYTHRGGVTSPVHAEGCYL